MTWRQLALAGLALALAFGVRWWWPSERSPAVLPSLPDPRFDYTLENFSARFSNDAGELELLVSGPRLVHDSIARTATLEQPRFLFEPDGGDWRGTADLARFERDDDLLLLEGNVRITQALEQGAIMLTGERLQHDRQARTISSHQTVEIRRPGTWLRAGGLRMELDDDTIELFNDVHAQSDIANPLAITPVDASAVAAAGPGRGKTRTTD